MKIDRRNRWLYRRNLMLRLPIVAASILLLGYNQCAQAALPGAAKQPTNKHRTNKHPDDDRFPVCPKLSDPYSPELSPEAVQLADCLQLTEKLKRLKELQNQRQTQFNQAPVPVELRQDITDTKLEIIEIIEQARLDIDFVGSEVEEELAYIEEALRTYTNERNERVNRANLWSFRANGILWAATEGLAIPTYADPKLSIPSGIIGIVAGLVPSVFSLIAMRSVGGPHHERNAFPNMLSKMYELPTTPRIEYPESVWKYLNLPTFRDNKASRCEILKEHWLSSKNNSTLRKGISREKIELITGHAETDVTIAVLTDRANMLREVRACVFQMTRPMMELMMCVRDKKQL